MPVSVNIKMYRIGELGDCFLLRFTNGQENTHVLIDCGSYWNNKSSIARLKLIAADIKTQIAGHKLDVVVGTHQHNDHLSGFLHAESVFKSMKPEQVWLSWLDEPGNKQAEKIGKDYNNYLGNLKSINKELQKSHFAGSSKVQKSVAGLLGFFGIDPRAGAKTTKTPAEIPAKARKILQKIGKKDPEYLEPGEIFNLPGISGGAVKVYVLGPPIKDEFLYKKEPRKDETFDHKLSENGANAEKLLSAMKKLTGVANTGDDAPFPFDEPYRDSANFTPVEKAYKKEKWRRIELDWINQAEQLALWLDGFTNNSSLVLAFEIVKTKKVLLFAADAQAGNWRSWKEIKWKKKMPPGFNWLTLMNNTVLYKTGHHGSHNSTLSEALNNMLHEELVVLIPVEKSDPMVNYGKGWQMPATNLYKELKKRSQHRIIRMDDGISNAKAWKNLPNKPSKNALFWEYEVNE
ncbi:MAG TPA: MBL fold metallo-hydrolase [Chitinophagaceae bacterium]|nr:MBL fold metallo-hydrolase [Chitinophagaceae bacterium]